MKSTEFKPEEFARAVHRSCSAAEVLRRFDLKPSGANYRWINRNIRLLSLDTSHWLGQAHLKGKTHNWTKGQPLDQILIENSSYVHIAALKKRLLRAGLLSYQCAICHLVTWLNKPLPLQLDHINGVTNDHRLENLRLLCPNCHAQTDTFGAKNAKRKTAGGQFLCLDCQRPISKTSIRCRPCAIKVRHQFKIDWPPATQLMDEVAASSYLAVARRLGVSDNAIRKHIQRHSIS